MSVAWVDHPSAVAGIRPGAPAVIEASAGTGKTYTLTRLVADRILRGLSTIDRVLVVTFTEKATQELRSRLRALLESLRDAPPGGRSGEHKWRIGDEERGRLRAAVAGFDSAQIFTIHGFCQRALAELSFVTGRPLSLSVVDGRRAFASAYRRSLRRGLGAHPDRTPELLRALDSQEINALGDTLGWMHEMKVGHGSTDTSNALIWALMTAIASAPPSTSKKVITARGHLAVALRATSGPAVATGLLEAAKSFGNEKASSLEKGDRRLFRMTLIAAPVPDAERGEGSTELSPLLSEVEDDLARAKAASGEVDFNDMLTELSRILDGPSGAHATALLRRKYDAAVVDEFQDTDDTQWSIFKRIFVDAGGTHPLYVVGDPKQAIYAFRGADVLTYLDAKVALERAGAPVLTLSETRRSTPQLTCAVNVLLSMDARRPVLDGLTPYDQEVTCASDVRPLRRGRDELAPIVIATLTRAVDARTARRATVSYVADEIARLLGERPPTRDAKGALTPSDLMVLGYATSDTREVGDALRERGIPHTVAREVPLFMTYEAMAARDVVRALADARDARRQRLALVTPFFGVPWRELDLYREVSPAHPLARAIAELSSLAMRGRWAEVFAWLADESGMVARARLADQPQIDVPTMLAVLDALAREAAALPLSPEEMADLADALVAGRAQPAGGEKKVAAPTEDAVRLLTVHGSKGLEAKVVFVVGGRNRLSFERAVTVHDGAARRTMIGKLGPITKKKHEAERDEEDRRLAYVALTRAAQRLYLVYAPASRALNGAFVPVQDRLEDLVRDVPRDAGLSALFELVPVDPDAPIATAWQQLGLEVGPGKIHDALVLAPPEPPALPKAPRVTSYTAERHREPAGTPRAVASSTADPIPGGVRVGRAIHMALERISLAGLAAGEPLDAWVARPEHVACADAAKARHGAHEIASVDLLTMVHRAYTTPLDLGDATLPPLASLRLVREAELAYPWPETAHLEHDGARDFPFRVERGLVRGYVDVIATDGRLSYLIDWKSDRLPSYDSATLGAHVASSYALQAQIYAVGVHRQLALTRGRQTLGGVLFVFLRGLGASAGVCAMRPTDAEIDAWELSLRERDIS